MQLELQNRLKPFLVTTSIRGRKESGLLPANVLTPHGFKKTTRNHCACPKAQIQAVLERQDY